jgi:hypothetical protein
MPGITAPEIETPVQTKTLAAAIAKKVLGLTPEITFSLK